MENRRQALRNYCPNILRPGAYVAWWFQANGISNRRPAFAKVNWKKKPRCNIICQIRKSVSKGNPYRVEIHSVFGTKHGLQKPDASFIFPNIPHISTNWADPSNDFPLLGNFFSTIYRIFYLALGIRGAKAWILDGRQVCTGSDLQV